jgi:hypothetical protein
VTLRGEVALGHIKNKLVATTGGAGISTDQALFAYDACLVVKGTVVARDKYAKEERRELNRLCPMQLVVGEKRISMTFGTVRLGQETSQALAGQAELFGGTSGTAFRGAEGQAAGQQPPPHELLVVG